MDEQLADSSGVERDALPKKQLKDLPNELLQHVSDSLDDTSDVLNLRLVDKAFAEIGKKTIQHRFRVLYLDPSEASLRCFLEICNDKEWAGSIRMIIFVAYLQARSPEEIRGEDCFLQEVKRLQCGDETAAKALRSYELHTLEQQHICQRGWSAGRAGLRPFKAYNRDRCWRIYEPSKHSEGDQASSSDLHQLTYAMRFRSSKKMWICLTTMIKAIDCHSSLRPSKKLKWLIQDCPVDAISDNIANFSPEYGTALSCIDDFNLDMNNLSLNTLVQRRDGDTITVQDREQMAWNAFNNWRRLLGLGMDNLRDLTLTIPTFEAGLMCNALFEVLELKKLSCLAIYADSCWCHGVQMFSTVAHTTQRLESLLDRHRDSIERLYLCAASGIDEHTKTQSTVAFQELLMTIKTKLTKLKKACAIEVQSVFLAEDFVRNAPPREAGWEQKYRDIETTTAVGLLARGWGAKVAFEEAAIQCGLYFTYEFGHGVVTDQASV